MLRRMLARGAAEHMSRKRKSGFAEHVCHAQLSGLADLYIPAGWLYTVLH